jgi:hypothetical protein
MLSDLSLILPFRSHYLSLGLWVFKLDIVSFGLSPGRLGELPDLALQLLALRRRSSTLSQRAGQRHKTGCYLPIFRVFSSPFFHTPRLRCNLSVTRIAQAPPLA